MCACRSDPDKTPTAPTADFTEAPSEAAQFAALVKNILDEKLGPVAKALYDLQSRMVELETRMSQIETHARAPSPISWFALGFSILNLGMAFAMLYSSGH